jgi:hypothetical protein
MKYSAKVVHKPLFDYMESITATSMGETLK